MPIEIQELNIRVNVNQPAPQGDMSSSAQPMQSDDKDALVASCVEEVLKIIHDKKER